MRIARTFAALAAGLLGSALPAQPQTTQEKPFVPPPRFEMISWANSDASQKVRVDCTFADSTVRCTGAIRDPDFTFDQRGRFEGRTFIYDTTMVYSGSSPNGCAVVIEYRNAGRSVFRDDGTRTWSDEAGAGRVLRATPACGDMSAPYNFPATSGAGTWSGNVAQPPADHTARLLWPRLGIAEGDKARACFAETLRSLNEPRNREMKENISRAVAGERLVEASVRVAQATDDFDGDWWAVADGMVPKNMTEAAKDQWTRLLPGPLRTLFEAGDQVHKASTGANEKVMGPYLKGQLYEGYVQAKISNPGMDHEFYVREAGAYAKGWEKLVTDLSPKFPGATQQARVRAMCRALGTRFDLIQRVREVAGKADALKEEAWKDARDDVARLAFRTRECIIRP